MHLFETTTVPKPDHPGLKVWSTPRTHWRHYIERTSKGTNEIVNCGVWWWAQYDDGTVCSGVCPLRVAEMACGYAKERV